jgi:DNA-binding MarR family transcriptional regulator
VTYTTKEEFEVLHGLKIRGLSKAGPLAESTGITTPEVQKILDDAVARGLARSRTGRVEGYMVTAAGRQRHAALWAGEVTAQERDALVPAYEAFLEPNRQFKVVTTEWQTGDRSGVLPRLLALHDELGGVLSLAASAVPRMKRYQPRFDRALAAFQGGDGDALARPLSGSYHDVWMELHEDLLATMGRERAEADE